MEYNTKITDTQISVWMDFIETNIQECRERWDRGDHTQAAITARMINVLTTDLAVNLTQISRS